MKKSNIKKKVRANRAVKNDCSWFDPQNARLIVLCATLGIFGAHKFAQHKYFQGFLYILLDLTVFGIILTLILSWLDLIFLTAKSDNRPGNMILGSIFVILESFVFMPGYDLVIKNINPESKNVAEIAEKSSDTDDAKTNASEEIQLFMIDDNGVKSKVAVKQDNIVLMVSSNDAGEPDKRIVTEDVEPAEVVNEEFKNKPVIWVDGIEESAKEPVVQPKKQKVKKQTKKSKGLAKDKQEETNDDFGSFSLYGMIAGE